MIRLDERTDDVETSPAGDTRDHRVPCQVPTCRRLTLNYSAVCNGCRKGGQS